MTTTERYMHLNPEKLARSARMHLEFEPAQGDLVQMEQNIDADAVPEIEECAECAAAG